MKMQKKDGKYCIDVTTYDEALLFEMMWFMYEKAKEAITVSAEDLVGCPASVAEKILGFPILPPEHNHNKKDESNPA